MKSLFVMPGFHSPKADPFGLGGQASAGPRMGQDFWGSLVSAIPVAIDKGTDIYLKREDAQIAEDKADEAKAKAAQALVAAKAAVATNTIAGIDKGTFIIGAIGIGLVAIIGTIALTR
jgi:hypothetical protein